MLSGLLAGEVASKVSNTYLFFIGTAGALFAWAYTVLKLVHLPPDFVHRKVRIEALKDKGEPSRPYSRFICLRARYGLINLAS